MSAAPSSPEPVSIARHKTAIRRPGLSVPVQCLLRDGLLDSTQTFFDYGCGRGQDLLLLSGLGISCSGWDPAHRPDAERRPAPIVNLGYVINVIEDHEERSQVLREAWELCESLLVVAAQSALDSSVSSGSSYEDGILTSRGTFQKYYTHQELRDYIQSVLPADAVAAAPNVFYLFRSEDLRQRFTANRYRRRIALPRLRVSERLYEENQDVLQPFIRSLTELGRLPGPDELSEYSEIQTRFGSLKRAFAIVRAATGAAAWETISARRREDLLVYLALARFGRRKPLSHLPLSTQRDIKSFLGTYQKGLSRANELLFSVGNANAIDEACKRSSFGLLVENALVIDREKLEELEPILRVYEGCARALLGEVEGANVVKLHRFSGKVTYLAYDGYLERNSPSLRLRVKVNLRSLDIDFFDYSRWVDPPKLEVDAEQLVSRRNEPSMEVETIL